MERIDLCFDQTRIRSYNLSSSRRYNCCNFLDKHTCNQSTHHTLRYFHPRTALTLLWDCLHTAISISHRLDNNLILIDTIDIILFGIRRIQASSCICNHGTHLPKTNYHRHNLLYQRLFHLRKRAHIMTFHWDNIRSSMPSIFQKNTLHNSYRKPTGTIHSHPRSSNFHHHIVQSQKLWDPRKEIRTKSLGYLGCKWVCTFSISLLNTPRRVPSKIIGIGSNRQKVRSFDLHIVHYQLN